MNAVVKLAHAAAMRPTLTSAVEWQRLAQAAVAEHDRVRADLAKAQRAIANFGPKFQGMTDLA
jgi:hypothetical protein